jgi:hypothetical protein
MAQSEAGWMVAYKLGGRDSRQEVVQTRQIKVRLGPCDETL